MKKIEYQLLNTCKLTKYILDVSNRKQLQRITIVVCQYLHLYDYGKESILEHCYAAWLL